MAKTETEGGGQESPAFRQHEKKRMVAEIGEKVEIPGHSIGITVSDLSPLGDSVQISWLEPVGGDNYPTINDLTVRAIRTDYTDDSPVKIPYWAAGLTVSEPTDSPESVIFWLE